MRFDDIASVEAFYKNYAHHVGFGVRLGSQRMVNNVIHWKRFLCAREGYRSTKGAFDGVGCTKKDLQNYYSEFKNKIKNCDAQMLVDQFGRLKQLNAAFFFEYDVDEDGTLLLLFWADATSRKNYSHFHDVLSFDSTYSTN
ncbi:hypothetical protein QYE76_037984 [Lolium multiflorum]|uniref:FAR1 domain-containing protein n=1 Tax=Lolium multiflorum TaxID=4521 RepID=A0AAD8T750_LOLMU|nr:hypothetical protein QYE76_037984 [Lolium multiflorum]